MRRLILIIPFMLILAFLTFAREGTFADFTAKDPDGNEIVLSEFVAEGPIILTFWATWCKPCIKELNKLTEMEEFLEMHGVRVLAVCEDGPRTRNRVKPFAQKNGWDFTIAMDTGGGIKSIAGVADIPEFFILSPEMEILYHHMGYKPGDEVEYKEQIKTLFPIEKEETEAEIEEEEVAQ